MQGLSRPERGGLFAMRISVLNNLFFALLLATSVGGGVVTLFYIAQSRAWEQRIALAHASYAEHLSLQSNVYQLFKQHGDALLFGDRDEGALEGRMRAAIAANLSTIRSLIGREIKLIGEEEIEELGLLAEIEGDVASLTRMLTRLAADGIGEDGQPVDDAFRRERLVRILDGEMDDQLSVRIVEALEAERAEVAETLVATEKSRRQLRTAVIAVILAAVVLAVVAGLSSRSLVVIPARKLRAKVKSYGAGNYGGTAPVGGAQEFRELDVVLDRMAEALDRRELSRREQTALLEAAVAARTAELGRALTQIEASEASRRQMMADVSHELRTPLTIIQGEADVSLRGVQKTPEVYREALLRIRETASHTNHIVDDLLLIARQEAGKLRLDLKEVDLCAILRDTSALLTRPVELEFGVTKAVTRADPVRLRQCLLALFQNASRYGGDRIAARIDAAPNGFVITVEDNGPGMSEAEKAQAFERFFRGSNAARPDIGGTGLGLPIVRSILRAHDGSVTLDDREDGGLRVSMTVPAERPLGLVWDRDGKATRQQ